ncbi:hypothetical protein D3C73_1190580 [compost metagenome]
MQQHVDLFIRETKQPVGFNYLQAFVNHRCRIDRDLRAHGPVRMPECIFNRDVPQLLSRPVAEGTARGGYRNGMNIIRVFAIQALEYRGMLAVDRQQ